MKHGVGDFLHSCAHSIGCINCANDCGPTLVAALILYSDTLYIGDSDKVLPYFLGKAALIKLVAQNGICFAESLESVTCDSSETSYTQAGTGEWLTVDHAVRQAECLAYNSYLVLEEKLQGLDELKLKILGKSAHVVV